MKRYLVFTGDVYYAGGGWRDLTDSFDDLDQARLLASHLPDVRWGHVVDSTTMKIVYERKESA
jgi:hypothetical protein